ncbi:MAG: YidH family protein [Pirellula sp.]
MVQISTEPALKLDIATKLAIERTRVAYERTIMASVRTATSLITFGFSAYKFFRLDIAKSAEGHHIIGPKQFGIAMMVLGLAALSLAWIEYRRDTRSLRSEYPEMPRSSIGLIAILVAAMGVILLIVAMFNG